MDPVEVLIAERNVKVIVDLKGDATNGALEIQRVARQTDRRRLEICVRLEVLIEAPQREGRAAQARMAEDVEALLPRVSSTENGSRQGVEGIACRRAGA